MESRQVRLAIFASGTGSNAQALIEHFQKHTDISTVALLSNNSNAYALQRAEKHSLQTLVFNREQFYKSQEVLEFLQAQKTDFIILAGFLWLVPEYLVGAYDMKIINIHPALLPKYGGKGMYGHYVHEAVVNAGEVESGISIHLVNKVYDDGAIIFQARCPVLATDTPVEVAQKVQELEHRHFPKVVEDYIRNFQHRTF